MKILCVEDNDDYVNMLKNGLSRADFTVIIAPLMDLTLPDIDGEEATQRIKAQPATKHIPIIALMAHAIASDREKALAAGCDDFDTKPVDMPRLLEKIEALKSH